MGLFKTLIRGLRRPQYIAYVISPTLRSHSYPQPAPFALEVRSIGFDPGA